MQDHSLDTKIPDEFVPSPYHKESLEKALTELENVRLLTNEEAERKAARDYRIQIIMYEQARKKCEESHGKYESMLQQVRSWNPPTANHKGLKKFMIEQLEETIKFDCSMDCYPKPEKLSGVAYRRQLINSAKRNIAYHVEQQKKEEKSAKERTTWIQALRDSLPEA